ncbi:MAG: pitrilysin family protein [Ferruginibacter sp.]|nr:insulinase family protein [Ferruginibacter sp.]
MKKYLIAAIGIFCLQNTIAQIKIDRSKKPAAGPAPTISFKDPATFVLPNGITVLVVENHKIPKVRANFSIDRGPVLEGNKAGVMDLMGGMLGEGTTNMTKAKFDEAVDIIGADVNLFSSGGSASALTRYFEKAFLLMADGLKNPSFPADAFDKLKSQTITGLKSNEKNVKVIAGRVAQALSYGKNTALGEFVTEESVKELTLNDVKNAYKNYITPSRSYLTFVGDITPAAAKALVTKAFANWSGKKLELAVLPTVKNTEKTEINFVDIPTAVQGELTAGNIISNPLGGPDFHALLLANQILGGGAESKLFMNLREKHGFTYGAYSSVGNGRFQSLFKAGAAVRTDKVDSAVQEMVAEILNMRDGKITNEELASAKAKFNGSFALGMEDPSKAATYASNILINNLPKDYYKTYLQKINAVTIDDIKRVAKNYFSESNSRIVVVGNGKKIIPSLMRLGYPIKKFDKYANPVADEVKDVKVAETGNTTDAVSGNSIMQDYFKAIGGKEEAAKITTTFSTLSMEMMGRQITGEEKKMAPNKIFTEFKMGPMTVFKKVFDGAKGFQMQGPQKVDMTEGEIKEALDEKGVIPQLFYTNKEYMGKGKVGDEETYRLKVIFASGRTSVQQYSIKTGLLLQEETTSKQGDVDSPTTIEYKDYKKVGTVLFPHNIIQSADGQEFNMKVTEIKINTGVAETDFK